MFSLINRNQEEKIQQIVETIHSSPIDNISKELCKLISSIKKDIPVKKRISYGRYSIIKKMGLTIYPLLLKNDIDPYSFSFGLYKNEVFDPFVRSLAIQLFSIYGLEEGKLKIVLSVFEKAGADKQWVVRECSAGFIRKLIKKYPVEMEKWYVVMSKSDYPNLRRFSSESIRPVADNKWFKNNPDFCFSILKNLYEESHPYPRTSVGNNLSDWSKIDKERVFSIVRNLVDNKNKNSYWIAYRACRNLVKIEPIRVMNVLGVDEYKYKKNVYIRTNSN